MPLNQRRKYAGCDFFRDGEPQALKLHNPRSLIKKLPGFLRLRTQDPVNLPLPDNRISFFTNTDILAELEKQLGPLERQSETAKVYLKKKETLKIYDVNMFLLETARDAHHWPGPN